MRSLLLLLLLPALPAVASPPLPTIPSSFDAESCSSVLDSATKDTLSLDPRSVKHDQLAGTIQSLWSTRLALRARMKEIPVSPECVRSFRHFMTAVRGLEDYLGERLVKPAPFDSKHPNLALTGVFPSLLAADQFELRSGDIIASRGVAYTSAAIARVADDPGQFSHLSILYIDPRTNEKFIVQSLIETGANVIPFAQYVADGKGRASVYRLPDPEFAATAARLIYEKINHLNATGHHILYDFHMNLTEHSTLFCTELVSWAYELATAKLGRHVALPLFPSHISMRNRDFLNATGMNARVGFLPIDMDVDTRFDLVAEWRDFSQMRTMRHHEQIIDAEFSWMNRLDYTFSHEVTMQFLRGLGYDLRRAPLLSGLVSAEIPLNMSKDTLGAVVNLFLASIPINTDVSKADDASVKATGFPLTAPQLRSFLEKYRAADYERYRLEQEWRNYGRMVAGDNATGQEPENSRFHDYLRPRKDL
ncbi:MAG: YiiX/YebB-like N1pC/P60 family cysteine hydrolase [Bdellovibrionota bacterium]